MRFASLPLALLASTALAGCGDDGPSTPDAPTPDAPPDSGPGTTINITFDKAPQLVAFREGVDGPWKAATMVSATAYKAEVRGPYIVAGVCHDTSAASVSMSQVARALDDEHDIQILCNFGLPAGHAVTGHMVQAGFLALGDAIDLSSTADWDFNLTVPAGSFDLIAISTDRIAFRRALAVSADLALTPQIDLTMQGTPLVVVPVTVTNAAPGESLVTSVLLDTPTTSFSRVYRGPLAGTKLAPESALIATDNQTASVHATNGGNFRALRRPLRVGGNTTYTLPPPLALQFAVENGMVAASFSGLMPTDNFDFFLFNTPGPTDNGITYDLFVTPRFAAATSLAKIAIDTGIPGFKPEWKLDLAREYERQASAQTIANGEISSRMFSETANMGLRTGETTSRPRAWERRLAAQP